MSEQEIIDWLELELRELVEDVEIWRDDRMQVWHFRCGTDGVFGEAALARATVAKRGCWDKNSLLDMVISGLDSRGVGDAIDAHKERALRNLDVMGRALTEQEGLAEMDRLTREVATKPYQPPTDTDVAAVAKYDLERACQRHGCVLWGKSLGVNSLGEVVEDEDEIVVTFGGRAFVVNECALEYIVESGESIDEMVKAWVDGVGVR